MSKNIEIRVPAKQYEDEDDCLQAAAADYAEQHDLQGWDLSPRWADEQREEIVLTVPAWAAAKKVTFSIEYIRYERDESGLLRRKGGSVILDDGEREREYPHAEDLRGWPESKVYWDAETGFAYGVAVA